MENGHGRPRLQIVLRQFFHRMPRFCCFCHRKTNTGYDLCQFCRWHLPPIVANPGSKLPSSVCLQCGFTYPDRHPRQVCAQCVNYQTGFSRIVCPYRYDFPIDGIIRRLKYEDHLPTGRLLGQLLAETVRNQLESDQFPDCLLPVPLNTARLHSRGFNHAAEIARWCGDALEIESYDKGAGRRIDTGSLAGLSRAERGLSIRGAFWVSESLRGRRVAIVDDVLTTGATAGELATELLDNGVADVQLWVVARTPARGSAGGS